MSVTSPATTPIVQSYGRKNGRRRGGALQSGAVGEKALRLPVICVVHGVLTSAGSQRSGVRSCYKLGRDHPRNGGMRRMIWTLVSDLNGVRLI